jgi:hypothetical protein
VCATAAMHGLHLAVTTAQWAPQHAGYVITLECCRSRHITPAVLCRIDCCRFVCTTAVGRVAGCKRTGQQWVRGGHSSPPRCQAKRSAAGRGAFPTTLARIHSAVTLAIRPRCLRSTSHSVSLGLDRALFVCLFWHLLALAVCIDCAVRVCASHLLALNVAHSCQGASSTSLGTMG